MILRFISKLPLFLPLLGASLAPFSIEKFFWRPMVSVMRSKLIFWVIALQQSNSAGKRKEKRQRKTTRKWGMIQIFRYFESWRNQRRVKRLFFLLSKILNQIDRKKILRFNQHPNQNSKVDVCVLFWMTILIHVCVLGPWTRFNPWFNPSLRFFCENPQWTILQNMKNSHFWVLAFVKQKSFPYWRNNRENLSRCGNEFGTKLKSIILQIGRLWKSIVKHKYSKQNLVKCILNVGTNVI